MGIGDVYAGIMGGKSDFHVDPVKVDPNAYQYGGAPGGAAAAAQRYQGVGTAAQTRTGPAIDNTNFNQDRAQGQQARGNQNDAIALARAQATGAAPSVAAIQQKQGLDAAMLAQGSAAASARGPAGLANAQYTAAGNQAAMGVRAVNDASSLRAGEIQAGTNALIGATGQQRAQDLGSQQASAQNAQAQAQLEAGQRGLNDNMQLGMTGYETGVNNSQLQAQMGQQAQQSQNDLGAQALNQKADAANAAAAEKGGASVMGMASSALGMFSDERLKTDIKAEGQASVFDGYNPTRIGTPNSPLPTKDPSQGGGMGIMGMNTAALGYANNAPRPPPPGATLSGKKPSIADTIINQINRDDAAQQGDGSAFSNGKQFGDAFGGAVKKLDGSMDRAGGGMGGSAEGPKKPSDANQKVLGMLGGMGGGDSGGMADAAGGASGAMGGGPAMTDGLMGLSDSRAKREVHDEGYYKGLQDAGNAMGASHAMATAPRGVNLGAREAAPAQMLNQLEPVSYNYKPGIGEDPNRRRYGIMAQDLQKTPMGASIVQDTPRGKMIDTAKGVGVALAGEANLNERIKALESQQLQRPDMASHIGELLARRGT